MVVAILYFLIICFLIYRNGFFGIIKDKYISSLQFILFFSFKCLAIPTFYWVYDHYYGGLKNFDAGKFFDDSKVIQSIAFEHPFDYIKLLFGFQEDGEGSFLYENYIKHTTNWDEGTSYRLFFNDNKTIIRFHSLVHFISFHNYFVHAFISCLLGFIGIVKLYKAFKYLFGNYELWVLLAFVCLPNLWLFSGALLKEPVTLFQMGVSVTLIDVLLANKKSIFKKLLFTFILIINISILKPQIIIPFTLFYALYKLSENLNRSRGALVYSLLMVLAIVIFNFVFIPFKHTSMVGFINKKQIEFYDMMKGGIFLKDNIKFIRLAYDQDLVIRDSLNGNNIYKIKKGVPYIYWEHSHQKDTLYCNSNSDTLTKYEMAYIIVPANSAYEMESLKMNNKLPYVIFQAIFKSLAYPIKFNNILNSIVSIENIFNIICFLISLIGLFIIKERLPLFYFLSMVILFLMVFGISTPNIGAIVRYRCVITPFLVLSAILTLKSIYDTRKIFKRT